MSRSLPIIALAALAVAASPVAAEPVDERPRTVSIDVVGDKLQVSGHTRTAPGYTRLRFRARGTGEGYSLALIELKPGRTPDDVARIPLAGLQDAREVEKVGRLVAGATLFNGQRYVTRVVLRDRRYVVADITHEDQQSVSFRPAGTGDAVEVGHHDASITIRDDALRVPSALPRKGLLRIRNRGAQAHSLVALKIRSGLSTAEAKRQVRNGVAPDRIGRRYDLLGVVSAGTISHVEATLPRGRYVLVSYYGALFGQRSDVARGLIAGTEVV